jgi:hypothetical protein
VLNSVFVCSLLQEFSLNTLYWWLFGEFLLYLLAALLWDFFFGEPLPSILRLAGIPCVLHEQGLCEARVEWCDGSPSLTTRLT